MKINTIEVAGFASALTALRLPFSKETRSLLEVVPMAAYPFQDSILMNGSQSMSIAKPDLELMQRLIKNGDEHAKPVRGIIAYADITAPIAFWWDLETYRAGHERLFSESTMNTEGRRLVGKELQEALGEISFMREIRKIDYFSYQTLRRIVMQRYNHRKPEFHVLIEWMRTLPMADELIFVGLEKELEVHNAMYRDYLAEL